MPLVGVTRENEYSLVVGTPDAVRARIFANPDVLIEQAAINELIELLETEETIERIRAADPQYFGDHEAGIVRVVATPDFHKGAGVPIGTVLATRGCCIPQAIGKDVNCGMRLHLTGYTVDQVRSNFDQLETSFRHIFFQGGRNIPMTRIQREALFREGLVGLLSATPRSMHEGLWSLVHEFRLENELNRIHDYGSFSASTTLGLDDLLGQEVTRDGQIGTIGGGNHFVELQVVEKIWDGAVAHAWNLSPGQIVIMAHSGSVMIGHLAEIVMRDALKALYPKQLAAPKNGIFVLPLSGKHQLMADRVRSSISNAANFAFANRMFLGLMAYESLRRVLGEAEFSLLYDAPHNFMWQEQLAGETVFVHRKGATPARGHEAMVDTPFAYYGEPVLVPGSMGSSSFLLVGQGNTDAICSASHGAGRSMTRQKARSLSNQEVEAVLRDFRIVTPLNLRDPQIRMRPDIVERALNEIKTEIPSVYKEIGPVIQTLSAAGIARPVVELRPLMTLKN